MSKAKAVDIWQHKCRIEQEIPLFTATISAGSPSSADNSIDQKVDLNELLIKNSTATFFVRVEGNSMVDAGIHPDDILIVDKSLEPQPNNVVIAVINGEFLVKRLITENGIPFLVPENPSFDRIELRDDMQADIWGVVTFVIHKVK
jgi:DNA polymerase V